ncbi:MAG: inositol monophosphatase family protein [Acidimicrobiales bacterium]
MTAPDPAELLALAEPIACEVGDRLRGALEDPTFRVDAKSTATDLVTELDVWAERHITERLLAARPDDGVEGEEGADVAGTSGIRWCIDPIDGTVNFVHGIAGFNVSIAARVDGQTVAGVVASPLHDEVFTATLGGGSHVNGIPLRCASPPSLDRAVIGTGFAYDPVRRRRQAEAVARAIDRFADIRRIGAAALDLCWVGAGRLDGYFELGLNPWDHAAGALVAREAGAVVAGIDGQEPSDALLVAAAPEIWDDLADALRSAGAHEV